MLVFYFTLFFVDMQIVSSLHYPVYPTEDILILVLSTKHHKNSHKRFNFMNCLLSLLACWQLNCELMFPILYVKPNTQSCRWSRLFRKALLHSGIFWMVQDCLGRFCCTLELFWWFKTFLECSVLSGIIKKNKNTKMKRIETFKKLQLSFIYHKNTKFIQSRLAHCSENWFL